MSPALTDEASPLPIALSLGDPAGIGPEVIAAAWAQKDSAALAPFFVAGSAAILAQAAAAAGHDISIAVISDPLEAIVAFDMGLPVLELEQDPQDYAPGNPCEAGAKLALASLQSAAQLVLAQKAGALATAPVAKGLLANIGFAFPGQTEFLAHACGVDAQDAVMMLAGPQLRTVPLTVHCALADVPGRLSQALICRRARILAAALTDDFGIVSPRIAVAGLNPHAGEDGAFGDEEIRIIAPAIAALRAAGIDATGPYPADALFAPHARGKYDAAVCMYHDQALIPIKALDFDAGVNVTLGLPIIRTSPDHGTAFDIAGQKIARPGAMIAAIRMAGECAARRGL